MTDRLTESVIVDVIVRVALVAIWVAVAVILVTIVAETVHMVRHGGMALPSVRGLGWSQRIARFVAAGSDRGAPDHPRAASRGARGAGSRHDRERPAVVIAGAGARLAGDARTAPPASANGCQLHRAGG